jgi:hypothetical protein
MSNEERSVARTNFQTGGSVGAFRPNNLDEFITLAKMISGSDLAPKDYHRKVENTLVAMQMGAEVGLSPMFAVQNIAVVNGRPSLYGDAVLAVVRKHPKWDEGGYLEGYEGEEGSDNYVAVCQMRREGGKTQERRFSVLDAKRAGLWNKSGPWQQYPKRMLQMRARSWMSRDLFPDALSGLSVAEEAQDIPVEIIGGSPPGIKSDVEGTTYDTVVEPKSKTAAVAEKLAKKAAKKTPADPP